MSLLQAIPIARRRFLSGLMATSAITTFVPFARAIDPISVIQAGAAIVGIVSEISGMLNAGSRDRVLGEINDKLDVVIRNQVQLIEEIRSLRLYIDEALYAAFRQKTIVELNAHKDRFDILLAEPPTNRTRDDYLALLRDVEQTAFELGQYDIGAVLAFGSGVGMALSLHQILNLGLPRFRLLRAKFKGVYDRWLDPENPKSITRLVAATQSDVEGRRRALDAMPRTYVLGDQWRSTGGRTSCRFITRLEVLGDFSSGYSGRVSEEKAQCYTDEPRPCPRCIFKEIEETDSLLGAKMNALGIRGSSLKFSTIEQPVPVFQPSGYGKVDEFNRERIGIVEQMNRLARQQILKEQMEKIRDYLAKVI